MQVNGSTLWHARIARSSLEQNQHKRVGEFWLLKLQYYYWETTEKNCVCKIDEAMIPPQPPGAKVVSQRDIVTNHFEVIMVTNSS